MRGLLGCLLLFAGCAVPETLTVVSPDGPGYVAVLAFVGDELVGSTGLALLSEGEATYVVPRSSQTPEHYELVVFDEASLRAVHAPADPEVLLDGKLYLASDTTPALPLPREQVVYMRDRERLSAVLDETPRPLRELAAPWQPACPSLLGSGDDWILDLTCAEPPCLSVPEQNGCTLTLDLTICGHGVLTTEVDPRGRVHPTSSAPRLGDCVHRGGVALECQKEGFVCGIDGYPQPGPPPIVVERFDVFEGFEPEPQLIGMTAKARPLTGYLNGMTVLRDRIIVSAYGDHRFRNFDCSAGVTAELFAFDLDGRAVASTTNVSAPCVSGLAPDPTNEEGFLLAWRTRESGGDGRHWIRRFGHDLQPLGPAIELPGDRISPRLRAHGLVTNRNPDAVVLYFSYALEDGEQLPEDHGVLVQLDPTTLEIRGGVVRHGAGLDGDVNLTVAAIIDGAVVSSDEDFEQIEAHALSDLALRGAEHVSLRDQCTQKAGVAPGAISFHAESSMVVLPATDTTSTMVVLDWPLGQDCRRASFALAHRDGWTATTWPANPSLMVVGLSRVLEDEAASLALFDPLALRFVTDEVSIGVGVPAYAAPDRLGRVWMLQPGPAKLVRISAPP